MIIKYDGRDYSLDLDEITVKQAYVFKAFAGLTLAQFETSIGEADPGALICLFWLMLQQNGIETPIESVDFKILHFAVAFAEAMKAKVAEQEAPKAGDAE